MNRLTKPAAILAMLAALFAIGSLMPQAGNATPSSSPTPVTVTNTPLPVSGTVTVGNFPAGTQVTGTVGIDPNNNGVQVMNSPSVWVQNHTAGFSKIPFVVTAGPPANVYVGDVRSFPRLRLILNCIPAGGYSGEYLVSVLGGDGDLVIDEAQTVSGNFSKVYDLPARILVLNVSGGGGQCNLETLVLAPSD